MENQNRPKFPSFKHNVVINIRVNSSEMFESLFCSFSLFVSLEKILLESLDFQSSPADLAQDLYFAGTTPIIPPELKVAAKTNQKKACINNV